jgi:hypothetical protein
MPKISTSGPSFTVPEARLKLGKMTFHYMVQQARDSLPIRVAGCGLDVEHIMRLVWWVGELGYGATLHPICQI